MATVGEITLKILSLNVWGIFIISKDRNVRIKAIASELSSGKFDVVCLQEVWVEDDYRTIKTVTKDVLPYSHYFHSGVTGSGLCIFSKWPMEDLMFHQWPVNGYIHKVFHGDWFGGKGVGLCHLVANGVHINIYTTHLHAQYDMDDEYLAHRVVQAFDTAQFIRLTSEGAHLSILAGDLNTQPGELCHQLIVHTAQLKDSFEACLPESMMGTNECQRNSYADLKKIATNPNGDRIDHILYRAGLNSQVNVLNYTMPLEAKIPNHDFSYSDHEAIAATFKIVLASHEVSQLSCYIKDKGGMTGALKEAITVCDEAITNLIRMKIWYYTVAITLLLMLLSIPAVTNIPVLYTGVYQLTVIIASGIIFFTIIMATIWNRMEHHGILGGKLRMQIVLDRITNVAYNSDSNSDNISASMNEIVFIQRKTIHHSI